VGVFFSEHSIDYQPAEYVVKFFSLYYFGSSTLHQTSLQRIQPYGVVL